MIGDGYPRQTRIKLYFGKDKQDVTQDIVSDLLSFEYSDKDGGQADEISISLKDETGKWSGSWRPDAGQVIKAYLSHGTVEKPALELFCGTFYLDEFSVSGPPRIASMKAVSTPLNVPIRRNPKTRAWEKKSLKEIAESIATEAKLELFWDCPDDPVFTRQDQDKESDLAFMTRLCEESGLAVKVTDEQLVIFDQHDYEQKPAVRVIELGVDDVISWDFSQTTSTQYKSVTVSYRDPKQKKATSSGGYNFNLEKVVPKSNNPAVMTYTYEDESVGPEGQVYQWKKRAKSIDEAKRLAKAKLRQLNAKSLTGNVTIVGDVSLVAGLVVTLKGFGAFDGDFYIEEARHSVSSSGFTTSLSLHKVLRGY